MKRLIDFSDGVLPDGVTVSCQDSYDSDEFITDANTITGGRITAVDAPMQLPIPEITGIVK